MTEETRLTERELILAALSTFVRSRPGFEPANYGTRADYSRDVARATRQRNDALSMLKAISWRTSIDGDALKSAFSAFSGRLSWKLDALGRKGTLDYCTGQYYPTEFRAAVCAVLSQALWYYWRDQSTIPSAREYILRKARAELPRGVYSRWFKNS